MIKFEYKIIRYLHDRVTQEFVNVGLVIFDKESNFLDCKIISKYSRISNFFHDANGNAIISTLKYINKAILKFSKDEDLIKFDSLDSIISHLFNKDDSSLIFSETNKGIDINHNNAIISLYDRLVDIYLNDHQDEKHNDSYAWKHVYKKYFDNLGITSKLKDHEVKTSNDRIRFDKAWKNGVWNCYQTLSFDLKKDESIKNKVYKWSGILNELQTSEEDMNLYLLTVAAKQEELNSFINYTFERYQDKGKTKVYVVHENEAEKFAEQVKLEMEKNEL